MKVINPEVHYNCDQNAGITIGYCQLINFEFSINYSYSINLIFCAKSSTAIINKNADMGQPCLIPLPGVNHDVILSLFITAD